MAFLRLKNRIKITRPVMIHTPKLIAAEETENKLCSTFLWEIQNFGSWDLEFHGREIRSPQFKFYNMGDSMLGMGVFPKGINETDETASMRIYTVHGKPIVPFDGELTPLDLNGLPIISKRSDKQNLRQGLSHLLSDCPSQEDVFMTKMSSFLANNTLTLELRIWKYNGDFTQAEHISAVTQINSLDITFYFRILRFASVQLIEDHRMPFGNDFELIFTLKGTSFSDADLSFIILAKNATEQFLEMKLSLLDNEHKEVKFSEKKHVLYSSILVQTFLMPKFLSRQEIMDRQSDWIDDDGTLNLLCTFRTVYFENDQRILHSYCGPINMIPPITRSNYLVQEDSSETKGVSIQRNCNTGCQISPPCAQRCASLAILGEDLLSMYQSHLLSDFEIRCGDFSFPVHKNVLSARSEFFRNIICREAKESNFLNIPDLNVNTIQLLLTFLYAGTLDGLEWKSAVHLYHAANQYQVAALKKECLLVLRSNITAANVIDVIEIADISQNKELTLLAYDFIQNNYDEVILSEEWDRFLGRSLLAGKTMKELYIYRLQSENSMIG